MKNMQSVPMNMLRSLMTVAFAFVIATSAGAADKSRLQAFLNVTGFDVALESIQLSASSAPQMLGIDPGAFGSEWTRLSESVFDTDVMRDMALNILSETLTDDLLNHGAEFYASDLGQRLVAEENASHMMEGDEIKQVEGTALIAEMVKTGAPRLETLKRMNRAIDASGSGVRALQEIQLRFLLAASAAGIVELRMDADDLREALKSQEPELRRAINQSALAGAAYTYRNFSDADIKAYMEALEDPQMQEIYELMNAVQHEIMANRFETLAAKMAGLQPGQDI